MLVKNALDFTNPGGHIFHRPQSRLKDM